MSIIGIIPARWASKRFPGKVAIEIAGMSMLERVWRGAKGCARLRDVIVATDHPEILSLCESFGGRAVMTSGDHLSGTDRVAEVAVGLDDEIVVNIQGDEPLIEPRIIDAVIEALASDQEAPMATLVQNADPDALEDPNRVKVVLDRRGRALYFSRATIPAAKSGTPIKTLWQHVGLYAYRRDFLMQFVELEPGDAELAEGLEQLRALEHGFPIRVGCVEGWRSRAVDVPEDLEGVLKALREATPGKDLRP